jgi:Flp pilus assembly pilin Flp
MFMPHPQKASTRLHVSSLLRDDAGLSSIEHVIILVIVAAIAVGAWKTFGETADPGLDGETDAANKTVTSAAEPVR